MTVLSNMQKIRKGGKQLLAALLASAACAWATPAGATIDNTVVVKGQTVLGPVEVAVEEKVDVVDQIATLTFDKTATFNDANGNTTADEGETITYGFAVTNTGNVTLMNVLVSDDKATPGDFTIIAADDVAPAADSSDSPAAGWGILAPGDTIRSSATYVLTQDDVDAGSVTNTASVASTTTNGLAVNGADSVTTPLTTASSVAIEKSGTLDLVDGVSNVGDEITYQFVVTNDGPTTLRNVSINDPMLLASGEVQTNRLQDLIQLANLPSDPVTTASIPSVGGLAAIGPVEPLAEVPQLHASLHAKRKLVRMAEGNEPLKAGDRVGIYFDITNSGVVPLVNVSVTQPGTEAFGTTIELLAPNTTDSASVIFTHVLTDLDIADGEIDVVSNITADARGRKITETLRGAMALADVQTTLEIATASITPNNVAVLPRGTSTTFTATYKITQADIDAGRVLNTATVSATNTLGNTITATDSVNVPVPQSPAIHVEKTGALALGTDGKATVGDVVNYTFSVTNTGNATLDDVQLVDALSGVVLSFAEFDDFAPGDTRNFTGTYAITQDDINAGKVENQATASGVARAPGSPRVSGVSDDPATSDTDDLTVTAIPPSPGIALLKNAPTLADTNGNGFPDVGESLNWTFSVHNTGNIRLTNVTVTDRNSAVSVVPSAPTNVTIEAGATDTTSFRATYVLTQADIDARRFENSADVTSETPDGTPSEDASHPTDEAGQGPTPFDLTSNPQVAVLKAQPTLVDTDNNGFTNVGDVMTYQLRVTNTGNVTLTNVVVTDPNAGNFTSTIPVLAPGAASAMTLTASHTITAADITALRVTNQAFANTTFGDTPVEDSSDETSLTENDPTVTAIVPFPAIAMIKPRPDIFDANDNGFTDANDVLTYHLSITNTGNVPLRNITIVDPIGTVRGVRTTPLAVAETDSTTFKVDVILTPADIARGFISNQAIVNALSPTNVPVTDRSDNDNLTQDERTVTPLAELLDPKMTLVKQATVVDRDNSGSINVGDTIDFRFTVVNTGNTNLTNVRVSDPKLAAEGVALQPGNGVIGTLARNAPPVVLTASHVITQTDIDAGSYANQATVSGNLGSRVVTDQSDNDNPEENDETVVEIPRFPRIAVIKPQPVNDDVNDNGFVDPDDTLTYTFEVHNTGNVTLYNIMLTDSEADSVTGGPIPVLAPGAVDRVTFRATRLVTEDDARNGEIENTATASGASTSTAGAPRDITDTSDENNLNGNTPTVTRVVRILPVLTKVANRTSVNRGEIVEYTITATMLGKGPYDLADIMPAGFQYVEGSAVRILASPPAQALTPARNGNVLTFASLTPERSTRNLIIKLKMRASTALSTGDFINRARLYFNRTGELLAEAQAKVTIKTEHVFDCGEIVGRVFDDVNNNGYMDDGEPGLPGVRVATVNGLLVTTDKHGRFHVTCADIPDAFIGSNFLMKLDPRTLPAGYQLTTENPRDVRLTRGKITKLNFGVSKRRDIELDLTKDAFNGGLDLKPKYLGGLDRLLALLEQGRGGLTITYRCGVYAPIADERLQAVEELIQAKWREEGGNKPLKIKTRVECGK